MTVFEEVRPDYYNRGVEGCTAVLLDPKCALQVVREQCSDDNEPQTVLIEFVREGRVTYAYRIDAQKAVDLAEALARQALDIPPNIPFDWKPWPAEQRPG